VSTTSIDDDTPNPRLLTGRQWAIVSLALSDQDAHLDDEGFDDDGVSAYGFTDEEHLQLMKIATAASPAKLDDFSV
jgi:hypothetical protein